MAVLRGGGIHGDGAEAEAVADEKASGHARRRAERRPVDRRLREGARG